jgi:helix-turn-helix protein
MIDISTTVLYRPHDDDPIEARVGLDDALTVRNGEWATEIALSDVFDVHVGPPPAAANEAFTESVLIVGFEGDDSREVLFVDATKSTLDNVAGVLYRQLLNDIETVVSHPTNIGGRVTEKSFEIGRLLVAPGKVGCRGLNRPFSIDLETIVDFSRSAETLMGERRPVITIKYVRQGVAVSLKLSLSSARKQHLLGRVLRRDYDRVRGSLQQLDLPKPAFRALVKLYSLQGTASPGALVRDTSISVEPLVRGLLKAGLVETNDDEIGLTPRGWILVTEHVGNGASDPDLER